MPPANRRDHDPPKRLVPFAVRLHVAPLLKIDVHQPALRSDHRIQLNRSSVAQRVAHAPLRLPANRRFPSLPVTAGIHHHPLPRRESSVCGLSADELDRVDRLPVLSDQKPQLGAADRRPQHLVALVHVHTRAKPQVCGDPP